MKKNGFPTPFDTLNQKFFCFPILRIHAYKIKIWVKTVFNTSVGWGLAIRYSHKFIYFQSEAFSKRQVWLEYVMFEQLGLGRFKSN